MAKFLFRASLSVVGRARESHLVAKQVQRKTCTNTTRFSRSRSTASSTTRSNGDEKRPKNSSRSELVATLSRWLSKASTAKLWSGGRVPNSYFNFTHDGLGIWKDHRCGITFDEALVAPLFTDYDPEARRFFGSFSVTSWNAQSLFCQDPLRAGKKIRRVLKLAAKYDIVFIQESHGNIDDMLIFEQRLPNHSWYCDCNSDHNIGGIFIIVKKSFEKHFEGPPLLSFVFVRISLGVHRRLAHRVENSSDFVFGRISLGVHRRLAHRVENSSRPTGHSIPLHRQHGYTRLPLYVGVYAASAPFG